MVFTTTAKEPVLASARAKGLLGACVAHVVHDGYTDQLYALLPVWQVQFGLSYAGLACVRVLYYGTMGLLQIPAERLTQRVRSRALLVWATLLAAVGYLIVALPLAGLLAVTIGLVVAGIGSSVQHPRGSLLITRCFGRDARNALGVYNFAGDLGKATLPAAVAASVPLFGWRPVVIATAAVGLVAAAVMARIIPDVPQADAGSRPASREASTPAVAARGGGAGGRGFALLSIIGTLDTAPRMGYLLFLPFLVDARGGSERDVGVALALLFAGGAFGKAVCGWLGGRLGVAATVVTTEVLTAGLVLSSLAVPLWGIMALLPLLGVMLNGTSSVLYGTVPDLAPRGDISRAFAIFYTGNIVMGGFAPIVYGVVADHASRTVALYATAATAASVVPLVLALRPALAAARSA